MSISKISLSLSVLYLQILGEKTFFSTPLFSIPSYSKIYQSFSSSLFFILNIYYLGQTPLILLVFPTFSYFSRSTSPSDPNSLAFLFFQLSCLLFRILFITQAKFLATQHHPFILGSFLCPPPDLLTIGLSF